MIINLSVDWILVIWSVFSVELLSTKNEQKKKKKKRKEKYRHQVLTACSVDCPES